MRFLNPPYVCKSTIFDSIPLGTTYHFTPLEFRNRFKTNCVIQLNSKKIPLTSQQMRKFFASQNIFLNLNENVKPFAQRITSLFGAREKCDWSDLCKFQPKKLFFSIFHMQVKQDSCYSGNVAHTHSSGAEKHLFIVM